MNNDISAMLSQHQRDALLAYYIGQYAPNCGDQYLKSNIASVEDVYEYLLLDPLVTNKVPTSRVASGISSIQQYINSMVMNVEHNVNTSKLDTERVAIWDNGASQYNIWAGEVELDTYPENYIDPTLRQGQTEYFKELTTDLNQNALSNITAQQAVMNYLNKFEQVANLDIISGYFDGTDQLSSVYYLLGQTKTSPYKYYWRSFDMRKNVNNTVLTDAWSEWKPINVAFNEEALVGTVRPVFLNNRLYLFWFEMIKDGQTTEKEDSSTFQLNAWSAWYDLSGKWSAPMLLASADQTTQIGHIDTLLKKLNSGVAPSTLVANCVPGGKDSPFINVSLFIADNSKSEGYDYFSIRLDYWMNVVKIGNNDLLPVYQKFDGDNQKVVQHVCPLDGAYKVTCTPNATHDCNGLLPFISTLINSDITINKATGVLEKVSMRFNFDRSYNMGISGQDKYGSVANYELKYSGSNTEYFSLWGDSNHNIHVLGNTIHAALQYEHRDKNSHLNNSTRFQLRLSSPDSNPDSYSVFDAAVPASLSGYYGEFDFKSLGCNPRKVNSGEPILVDMRSGRGGVTGVNLNTNTKVTYYDTSLYAFNGNWQTGSKIKSYGPSNNLAPMKLDCTESNFSFKNSSVMTYTYGIYIDDSNSAWRSYNITAVAYSDQWAPTIKTGVNTAEGSATYLDFGEATFPGSIGVKSVRLNTLFAKELINKASISIASLLDWKTQFTLEPPLSQSGGEAVPMAFSGANGIYFWELFFHMPHLVAWRLNEEGNYDDAQRWLHYIFNPAAQGRISDGSTIPAPPDYWSVRPLVEQPAAEAQGIALQLTTDVDALAKADPQHYQKTIFMAYLRNLIAAGDASYRQYTNDGLSLARLYYHQVSTLLGPRPDTRIVQHWQPNMLSSIEAQAREALTLRQHERSLSEESLLLGGSVNGAMGSDGDIFMAPLNTQLIGYWDTIDARVYNLHHNLTLEGLPMSVPLFAQPVTLKSQDLDSSSLPLPQKNSAEMIKSSGTASQNESYVSAMINSAESPDKKKLGSVKRYLYSPFTFDTNVLLYDSLAKFIDSENDYYIVFVSEKQKEQFYNQLNEEEELIKEITLVKMNESGRTHSMNEVEHYYKEFKTFHMSYEKYHFEPGDNATIVHILGHGDAGDDGLAPSPYAKLRSYKYPLEIIPQMKKMQLPIDAIIKLDFCWSGAGKKPEGNTADELTQAFHLGRITELVQGEEPCFLDAFISEFNEYFPEFVGEVHGYIGTVLTYRKNIMNEKVNTGKPHFSVAVAPDEGADELFFRKSDMRIIRKV